MVYKLNSFLELNGKNGKLKLILTEILNFGKNITVSKQYHDRVRLRRTHGGGYASHAEN